LEVNAKTFLREAPEGNRQVERLRYIWEDIKMNFQAILCDVMGFIRVVRERETSETTGSINYGKLSCLAEQLQASLCDSLKVVSITLLSI